MLVSILVVLIWSIGILLSVALLTLMGKKLLRGLQRRLGPDTVGYVGLLQPISDAVKLVNKQTSNTENSQFKLFNMAPMWALAATVLMLLLLVNNIINLSMMLIIYFIPILYIISRLYISNYLVYSNLISILLFAGILEYYSYVLNLYLPINMAFLYSGVLIIAINLINDRLVYIDFYTFIVILFIVIGHFNFICDLNFINVLDNLVISNNYIELLVSNFNGDKTSSGDVDSSSGTRSLGTSPDFYDNLPIYNRTRAANDLKTLSHEGEISTGHRSVVNQGAVGFAGGFVTGFAEGGPLGGAVGGAIGAAIGAYNDYMSGEAADLAEEQNRQILQQGQQIQQQSEQIKQQNEQLQTQNEMLAEVNFRLGVVEEKQKNDSSAIIPVVLTTFFHKVFDYSRLYWLPFVIFLGFWLLILSVYFNLFNFISIFSNLFVHRVPQDWVDNSIQLFMVKYNIFIILFSLLVFIYFIIGLVYIFLYFINKLTTSNYLTFSSALHKVFERVNSSKILDFNLKINSYLKIGLIPIFIFNIILLFLFNLPISFAESSSYIYNAIYDDKPIIYYTLGKNYVDYYVFGFSLIAKFVLGFLMAGFILKDYKKTLINTNNGNYTSIRQWLIMIGTILYIRLITLTLERCLLIEPYRSTYKYDLYDVITLNNLANTYIFVAILVIIVCFGLIKLLEKDLLYVKFTETSYWRISEENSKIYTSFLFLTISLAYYVLFVSTLVIFTHYIPSGYITIIQNIC